MQFSEEQILIILTKNIIVPHSEIRIIKSDDGIRLTAAVLFLHLHNRKGVILLNRYLYQTDVGKIETRIGEVPIPGDHQVRIKIKACGICGSDVHYFAEGLMGEWHFSPYSPGHEAAGIVDALGKDVTGLKVGDRVTIEPHVPCGQCKYCRSGFYNLCEKQIWLSGTNVQGVFADYVCTDQVAVFPIPDSMTFRQAAMTEPAAVGVHAVHRAKFCPGDTGIIAGLGTIGLLTLQAFWRGDVLLPLLYSEVSAGVVVAS